jgi:hypothetical protein
MALLQVYRWLDTTKNNNNNNNNTPQPEISEISEISQLSPQYLWQPIFLLSIVLLELGHFSMLQFH